MLFTYLPKVLEELERYTKLFTLRVGRVVEHKWQEGFAYLCTENEKVTVDR